MRTIHTDVLEIAFEDGGPEQGPPVLLLHGWPDALEVGPQSHHVCRGRAGAPLCRICAALARPDFALPIPLGSGQELPWRRMLSIWPMPWGWTALPSSVTIG